MYSSGLENENYLRGVQVADAEGLVRYTSIFPACYAGRWPHIHFEVYPDTGSITDHTTAIATSQVALPQETCTAVYATTGYEQSVKNLQGVSLDSDNVFGDDSGATQLATVTGDISAGYTVRLTVNVDTNTEATGGGAPEAAVLQAAQGPQAAEGPQEACLPGVLLHCPMGSNLAPPRLLQRRPARSGRGPQWLGRRALSDSGLGRRSPGPSCGWGWCANARAYGSGEWCCRPGCRG